MQVSLIDAYREEDGRKEFTNTLGHIDSDNVAVDAPGYTDVKTVATNTLVARCGSKVVMIYLGHGSNKAQALTWAN